MSLNERDVDVLARTIWGEARGEGRAGLIGGSCAQAVTARRARSSPLRQLASTLLTACGVVPA